MYIKDLDPLEIIFTDDDLNKLKDWKKQDFYKKWSNEYYAKWGWYLIPIILLNKKLTLTDFNRLIDFFRNYEYYSTRSLESQAPITHSILSYIGITNIVKLLDLIPSSQGSVPIVIQRSIIYRKK